MEEVRSFKLIPEIIEDDCKGCFFDGHDKCPNLCESSIFVFLSHNQRVFEFNLTDGKYVEQKEEI